MSSASITLSRRHRIALIIAAISPFLPAAAALLLPAFSLLQTTLGFAGILASACALLIAFATPDSFWAPEADRPWRDLAIAAAVLAGIVIVASALAANPAQTFTFGAEGELNGAPTWLAGIAILVLASRQLFAPALHRTVAIAVPLGVVSALVALVEFARRVPVTGGFGNADYLGMVMLLLVPLALVSARLAHGAWRWAYAAAALLLSLAAIAGGSSAVLVALVAEWIALATLAPQLFGRAEIARRVGYVALGVAGVVVVAAAAATLMAPEGAIGTLVRDTFSGATAQTRLEMWRIASQAWLARPVLGYGPDGMQLASQHAMTLKIVQLESAPYTGVSGLLRDPHSLPLMVLVSVGVVGALAVLAFAAAWVRAAFAHGYSAPRNAYAIAAVAFGACMLVMPWNDRFAALPALVAGLAVAPLAAPSPAPDSEGSEPAEPAAARPRPKLRIAAWLITALAAVLIVTAVAGDVLATVGAAQTTPADSLRYLRLAQSIQPTRPYLRYAVLYKAGQQLVAGGLGFGSYRSAVDQAHSLSTNGVYLALLAQPALDYYRLRGDRAALDWAHGMVARATTLAPADPDVMLERAHVSALTNDGSTAEQLLLALDAANVRRARMLLYAYYVSLAAGREADAAALLSNLRAQAPDLLPLAR